MSVNLGRVAYVEKGAYDSGTTYQKKDVVFYDGGSYVFIADAPAAGIVPTNAEYWQPMMIPARSSALIRGLAVLEDASGDIVTITDGADGMPVKSLVTVINTASGVDSVSVTVAGRNLLHHSAERVEDMTLKNSSGADISRKGYLVDIPAGAYVIKSEYKEGYTAGTFITGLIVDAGLQNHGKESLRIVNGTAVGTFKFSLEPGEKLALYNSNTSHTVSQTKTTFDKVDLYIFVDDGNTESEEYSGETLTAALPETVTEGAYDWLNGVLTKADGSTIQLTPQQLSTVYGENNIWSNAGQTEVTYVADTKLYIDQKIAAIAAAIV